MQNHFCKKTLIDRKRILENWISENNLNRGSWPAEIEHDRYIIENIWIIVIKSIPAKHVCYENLETVARGKCGRELHLTGEKNCKVL